MGKRDVKFEGLIDLQQGLRRRVNLDAVKTVVRKNGGQMNARMKQNASPKGAFVKGYSKGDTRDSINTELRDDGMTAAVGPTTEYSAYVEFGTRFMTAEPFIKPAWEAQKEQFRADMSKLVK